MEIKCSLCNAKLKKESVAFVGTKKYCQICFKMKSYKKNISNKEADKQIKNYINNLKQFKLFDERYGKNKGKLK